MLFLGIMFLLGTQPVMLMGSLVGLVFFYSLNIYLMTSSYWLGYIFMLVMLSGVLVLFSYMLSLFPNKEFEFSSLFLVIMFLLMGFLTNNNFFIYLNYSDYSIHMWMSVMSAVTIFMILFLLSMMVIVVWLSMMDEGSIRE